MGLRLSLQLVDSACFGQGQTFPMEHRRAVGIQGGHEIGEGAELVLAVADRRPAPIEHVLHWSTWRRQRQHQARTGHYKRRGHNP
ncbi:hypothetical protein [Streptomyces sp. 1222.5]|uniref:hypothetical protein n=1 Tax=Streptomyces sp. 1222.5 TaxID=1881026 RepID=UPI003EBB46B8